MGKIRRVVAVLLISLIAVPQIKVQAYKNRYEQVNDNVEVSSYKSYLSKEVSLDDVPEDLKLSREANKYFRKLVLKTDSNYEIAMAYSDGSYSYIDKADTYEDALEKCNNVKSGYSATDTEMPVVIDQSGQVVYAEKSVGRVRKYINNVVANTANGNCNVYPESYENPQNQKAYTYVNHDYISEVPLIETDKGNAKVLISGYEGWMSYRVKDESNPNPNTDLVIWPLNQVTNPSYYTVKNGVLVHFISMALDSPSKSGATLNVGIAPDYLKEGKIYISYDGNYFYDGINAQEGIWNVTLDLQENTKERSINKDEPYYAYNLSLPFRTKTNYTAEELDNYITLNTNTNSKLRGLGKVFKDCEEKYGVNAVLALGVAINETTTTEGGWGTSSIALTKNNLFGIGAVDSNAGGGAKSYESPEESVVDFTLNLISLAYTNPRDNYDRDNGGFLGNKNLGACVKYASDPFWGEKAANNAFNLDYNISGKNLSVMKDENYYQLIRYTGPNKVIGPDKVWFYDISTTNTYQTNTVGTIAPMTSGTRVNIDGKSYIEINAQRNHSMGDGDFTGEYDWSYKGYIEDNNIEFINEGKTRFQAEDLDEDGKITVFDLAKIGNMYNVKSTDSNWYQRYDLNYDNIIDIYDIVQVARKIE